MLSVCIPIYNLDVRPLVRGLAAQIAEENLPAEILLIDDASDIRFREINNELGDEHAYRVLDQNVGRAKIRNLFPPMAAFDYLLFLDCDATLISDTLLRDYCDMLSQKEYTVVCGGSLYPTHPVERKFRLRWKNGNVRETIPTAIRNQHPYASFMTSNVIIRKDVFDTVSFDESLVRYGHEDTLFGFELRKQGIPVYHYNNPVLNNDLDTNEAFVAKMETALENLALIWRKLDFDPLFSEDNKLLKMYARLEKNQVLWLLRMSFFFFKRPLKHFFSNGFSNLYVFDYYKLAFLSFALRK